MVKVESENTLAGSDIGSQFAVLIIFYSFTESSLENMVIVCAMPFWANVCSKSTVKTLEQSLGLILLLLLLAGNSWLP